MMGKLIHEMDRVCRAATTDRSGQSIWVLGDDELVRLDSRAQIIDQIEVDPPSPSAYQSTWLSSFE